MLYLFLLDAFKKLLKDQGRIDIFVNCAGICDGPQWEKEFATNVVSFNYITLNII